MAYADDFVVCFQYKSDAEWFYERLKHRMEHFGLSLEEEKSRLIGAVHGIPVPLYRDRHRF